MDTVLACYMVTEHGWRPRDVYRLPYKEKALMLQMILKKARDVKQLAEKR